MIEQTLKNSKESVFFSSHFFYVGSQEIASRVRASGCSDEYVFIEFESYNTHLLMLSEFVKIVQSCRGRKIVLISSSNLMPLAFSFASFLGFNVYVFSFSDPLSHVSATLSASSEKKISYRKRFKNLSIKEMMILEYTLKGYSAARLGGKMNLSTKTIFHWRKVIGRKLEVRKLHDLLCGACI